MVRFHWSMTATGNAYKSKSPSEMFSGILSLRCMSDVRILLVHVVIISVVSTPAHCMSSVVGVCAQKGTTYHMGAEGIAHITRLHVIFKVQ